MPIRDEIVKPYFVTGSSLPGLDFNREVHPPGTNDKFPEGVIGIRVDSDFWSVGALPWKYHDWHLRDIVIELWPEHENQAEYCPDSGTIEQEIYFMRQYAEGEKSKLRRVSQRLEEAEQELDRLRAGRLTLHERHPKRRKSIDNYFIRQYEHLLTAVAHESIPKPQPEAGICSICGLYSSDRVHMQKYIDLRNQGVAPCMEHLAGMTNDEHEDI